MKSAPTIFRFGAFVFDGETGALRWQGRAVRLSQQSAVVLAELLTHSNELVTRAQINDLLWPSGVYTEGNQGINNIISKLRTTLRDDPKKPRFIETIPQRGYRFLAPVEMDPESSVGQDGAVAASALLDPQTPVFVPAIDVAADAEVDATEHTDLPYVSASSLADTKRLRFASLGHNLGYIAVALMLVGLAGYALWRHDHRPVAPASSEIVLAVAPFELLNITPEGQQLAESFRLDLIDTLSQLPGIEVGAAHSTGQRGATDKRSTTGSLNLTAVLFTRFAQSGDQCHLQVEMVRSSDSTHLASWTYDGTTAQLGKIRDQVQRDIFTYWKGPEKTQRAARGGTEDATAYELYLHARYHARQRNPDALQASVKEYQQALDRDPQFAKAYAGLADANFALGSFMVNDSRSSYANAETYAARALQIAPDLPEAHAILGYMYFRNDWRFADGERELRQAITLEPTEPTYHVWYATLLTELRRFSDASKELDAARKYDPFWAPIYATQAYLYAGSGEWDKMNQATDMLLSLKPDWAGTYDELAWGHWLSGHPEKAIAEWRRMALMEKDTDRVALEDHGLDAFHQGGEKAYAKVRLQAAIERADKNPGDPDFQVAEWYAYAGDLDAALVELKKMVDAHDMRALEIAVNPAYAALRHNKDYRDLLRRVGLPLSD